VGERTSGDGYAPLRGVRNLLRSVAGDTAIREAYLECGGDPAGLEDEEAMVGFDVAVGMYVVLADRLGEPNLGLRVGERLERGGTGAFDLAMRAAPTLDAALRIAERYWHVVNGSLEAAYVETPAARGFALEVPPAIATLARHHLDVTIAGVVTIARDLLGRPVTPTRVAFSYAAPRVSEPYATFFRIAPVFDAPRTEVLFSVHDASARNVRPDPAVGEVMRRFLEQMPSPGTDGSIRARVRREIVEALPETPSVEEVARTLGMSERTLQRRLVEAGTSWAQLLDELRSDLAARHLEDTRMSIGEIAFVLGFRSQGSFTRAFKRWTGRTPSDARAHR